MKKKTTRKQIVEQPVVKPLIPMLEGESSEFPCGTKITLRHKSFINRVIIDIPDGIGTLWVDGVHRRNAEFIFYRENIPQLIEVLQRIQVSK